MENNYGKVCAIEKRIDETLGELSYLVEEMFNASSVELSELPVDYCASDEALQKAWALINRVVCSMKVQAVLEDSGMLDAAPVQKTKRATLRAVLEA